VRVRDEIKMTIQAYQTLYESSIAYGMRKALQAEQGKAEILIKIQNIEAEIGELESDVDDLKKKILKMLRDSDRDKKSSKEMHQDNIQREKGRNQDQLNEVKKILTTFEEIKREDD